jgi:hypothetical protein
VRGESNQADAKQPKPQSRHPETADRPELRLQHRVLPDARGRHPMRSGGFLKLAYARLLPGVAASLAVDSLSRDSGSPPIGNNSTSKIRPLWSLKTTKAKGLFRNSHAFCLTVFRELLRPCASLAYGSVTNKHVRQLKLCENSLRQQLCAVARGVRPINSRATSVASGQAVLCRRSRPGTND